jgi:hypothetical protein
MNKPTTVNASAAGLRHRGAAAWLRRLVPGLAFFATGVALSAVWFLRAPPTDPSAPDSSGPPALSDATKSVLQGLRSPVEIRFYSLLDPATVGDGARGFSARVGQWLSQYEQAAGGKIKFELVNSISTATANAALADGIQPFNMDKGDACYLGLVVLYQGQKTILASLAPEWEQAIEPDLSRAIASAIQAAPPPPPAPKSDVASVAAVRQAIPNLDAVSVEDGSRQLRVAALSHFKQTAQAMQAQISQAEEHLLQAQSNQSETDQAAALKELQQAQKNQAEKLREIALASKAQLEALRQLKGAAH